MPKDVISFRLSDKARKQISELRLKNQEYIDSYGGKEKKCNRYCRRSNRSSLYRKNQWQIPESTFPIHAGFYCHGHGSKSKKFRFIFESKS